MTTIGLFRNSTEFETFAAGAIIFDEGDPGHQMYAVKDGSVDIVVRGKVVETVEAGGIFGEMALIDTGARSAKAVARTECQLVAIGEKRFNFLVQQTPEFALQVIKIMAGRLRRADSRP
jgi:CRP-like cAMP-binding protein